MRNSKKIEKLNEVVCLLTVEKGLLQSDLRTTNKTIDSLIKKTEELQSKLDNYIYGGQERAKAIENRLDALDFLHTVSQQYKVGDKIEKDWLVTYVSVQWMDNPCLLCFDYVYQTTNIKTAETKTYYQLEFE